MGELLENVFATVFCLALLLGVAALVGVAVSFIFHQSIPSKTDEQVQCESVEGAVWGQHACFKNGIKLNFAEP